MQHRICAQEKTMTSRQKAVGATVLGPALAGMEGCWAATLMVQSVTRSSASLAGQVVVMGVVVTARPVMPYPAAATALHPTARAGAVGHSQERGGRRWTKRQVVDHQAPAFP